VTPLQTSQRLLDPAGSVPSDTGAPPRALRLPRWLDLLLNVFAAPLLLSGLAVHDLAYNGSGLLIWALAGATIWPLALRRRAPVAVFVICLLGLFVLYASASPPFAGFALLPALYTVAAHRSIRRALAAAAVLELLVVLEAIQQAPAGSIDDFIVVLSALAFAALFLGTTLRTQRRYLVSLEDRADRLERERVREAELAATAERTKIAREMHDIVAHGLSVVITLAEGAAARVDSDPVTARRTMEQVAATGRQSLGEMRRLLGVLRLPDDTSRSPQPMIGDLPALIDDVRATGLLVDFEVDGRLDDLDPTLQSAVFRVVQESLTNVIKHAADAHSAHVRVQRNARSVTFSVRDDGRVRAASSRAGNGLTGMAERAALFGGSVEASAEENGWTVRGEFEAVNA
jgi:signal transduction histidine kinase